MVYIIMKDSNEIRIDMSSEDYDRLVYLLEKGIGRYATFKGKDKEITVNLSEVLFVELPY